MLHLGGITPPFLEILRSTGMTSDMDFKSSVKANTIFRLTEFSWITTGKISKKFSYSISNDLQAPDLLRREYK